VSYNTPFVQLPVVTATPQYPGALNDSTPQATLTSSTALSFDLEVLDLSGGGGFVNRTINFIAVGPR
jgi:hypothetical protein